jgi:hypothetical protein
LTGYQLSRLTGDQLRWLTGNQLSRLTDAQLRGLTGEQLSCLTGEQLRGLIGAQQIPKVKKLYSTILSGIQNNERLLEQSTYGPDSDPAENLCKTPMCLAGHTVNIAGAYELARRIGFPLAATIIHNISRPDVPAPRYDTYPNEWAMSYIEKRAMEEI